MSKPPGDNRPDHAQDGSSGVQSRLRRAAKPMMAADSRFTTIARRGSAAFTQPVSRQTSAIVKTVKTLHEARSGQLPDLG